MALKGGGCRQLFQLYPSSGRCLRSHKASAEKVLNQWKSLAVSVTPKELICSLGGARFPSIFATCERWQLMNPSLIHLIEGISIWERWDAFFTPCQPVHVFRIQLRLQGQSGNVLVYRWSAMCVSATADIYNNVAHGFFTLWQTNNAPRSYKNLQTEEACANTSTSNQKVNIPAWWHHAFGRTTFC